MRITERGIPRSTQCGSGRGLLLLGALAMAWSLGGCGKPKQKGPREKGETPEALIENGPLPARLRISLVADRPPVERPIQLQVAGPWRVANPVTLPEPFPELLTFEWQGPEEIRSVRASLGAWTLDSAVLPQDGRRFSVGGLKGSPLQARVDPVESAGETTLRLELVLLEEKDSKALLREQVVEVPLRRAPERLVPGPFQQDRKMRSQLRAVDGWALVGTWQLTNSEKVPVEWKIPALQEGAWAQSWERHSHRDSGCAAEVLKEAGSDQYRGRVVVLPLGPQLVRDLALAKSGELDRLPAVLLNPGATVEVGLWMDGQAASLITGARPQSEWSQIRAPGACHERCVDRTCSEPPGARMGGESLLREGGLQPQGCWCTQKETFRDSVDLTVGVARGRPSLQLPAGMPRLRFRFADQAEAQDPVVAVPPLFQDPLVLE